MNVGMGHRFVQQQGRAHEHAELGCLLGSLNPVCQGGLSPVLSSSRRSSVWAPRTPRGFLSRDVEASAKQRGLR